MLLNTPRCPEKVISSPSGPCTMLTPGVSVSRSSNLRPRIGVEAMVRWSSVVDAAVRVVSIAGVWVVTVTVVATPETFIVGARWTASPTEARTSCITSVANPESLRVTVYRPGGNWSAANRPSRSVVRVRARFVSVLRTSTSTPGRTAPLESTTVPLMTAVVI